jgi:oligosaccharide repeat unit polymerase
VIVAAIAANSLVVLGGIGAVARKYGTLLNPVSFFGAFYFVATVIGPALYYSLGLFSAAEETVPFSLFLSALYFAAFSAAYLWRWSPLGGPLSRLVRFSRPFTPQIFERAPRLVLQVNGLLFVLLYLALMVTSGAGTLWLTDSREAYQYYRTGVGVFWALCQASLMLNFLIWLKRCHKSLWKVILCTITFSILTLFLGSKASTLAYAVIAAFYVHNTVRPIRTRTILIGGLCLLALAMGLQVLQGTASTAVDALLYFDYFSNSNAFVHRIPEFGFRNGELTLSMVWFYVPRALVTSKPYSYGMQSIGDFLYPGSGEVGFTPGFMQWAVPYADFGVAGVVLFGCLAAFVSRAAFEFFLHERSLESLVLLAQLGFVYYIEMFPNAPFLIFWCWMMFQALLVLVVLSIATTRISPNPERA